MMTTMHAEQRWLVVGGGLGALSAAAQVGLLRELLVGFRGNELSLGITMAAWLLWVAAGSAVGGVVARRGLRRDSRRAGVLSALALLVLAALAVVGIWLARDLRAILGVAWGEFIPTSRLVYATLLLVAPVAAAAGFAFPLICAAAQARAGIPPGMIYLTESLGFLVGGLASYAAAGHVPPFATALVVAAAGGIFASVAAWQSRRAQWLTAGYTAAVIAVMSAGASAGLESASLRHLFPGQKIVASTYSCYGSWVALAHAAQVSFYHNGALAFTAPQPMAAETLAHLTLLQHPDPRRVLLIGGGADGAAAELLKHGHVTLDYVELDPAVVTLARACAARAQPHLIDFMRSPSLHFHQQDGRLFVKRAARRYDVIIVNLPEPATALLNRYYTLEFFREARRAMTRRGVLCLGLPGGENYIGPEMQALHGSVYHSLRRVFADVVMTPGEKSYLLASRAKGLLTADAAELSRRWQQRAVPVRYFGPYYLEAILRPERVEFIRQSCRSAPRAVNRDFRPVGYFYDVAVMGLAEGALPHGLAARMQSLPGALFVAAAVAIFGLPFLISRRGRRLHRSAVVGGVAALGLAGMTMEVALIFALQVIVGHVYAQVGALIAIFMAGLAVGTWSQARASDRGAAAPRRWVAWLLAGSVAFAIIPVVLAALGEIPGDATLLAMVIIGLLMAAGGAVVGAVFPLAVGLLGDLPGAAGWVYAADLAGAALGACMTAVIALPLLGLAPTCYAAALIVAVSAALGAISLRRRRT